MTFRDMVGRMFALYGEKEYERALEVVQSARGDYPDEDNDLTFWEACLLARCGRGGEALGVLEEGVARGLWWPPGRLADEDLDPLRSLRGWEAVVGRCEEITRQKMVDRPLPIIREVADPAGFLIAIQGARAEQARVASTWESAAPDDWMVVTPAGAEPTPAGEWSWPHSMELSARSVVRDLEGLPLGRPLVLAGFSIGCAIAAHIAVSGTTEVDGVIAIAPASMSDFDELRALAPAGIPSLILCGSEDSRSTAYHELGDAVRGEGEVLFEMVEGLGHAYPEDLDARVTAFVG